MCPSPIAYELALIINCPFPAILFSLSASPFTGYLPLPRHFIFIITLFISMMVFTYGVFGYRLCCVVLQVVYHVRVLTVVFLLNDLSFCMILKGLYNVYVLTMHLKLLL